MGILKNKIFIATMCGHWREIAEKYGVGLELDFYCQSENMDGERGKKVKVEVQKIIEKHEAKVLHAPFNELFPAAIDTKARELAMGRLNQAAELSLELGVKRMVVHSGYMPFAYFKSWQVDRSVEFWQEFMESKPADFEIAIENVLDDEPYMLAEIAERVGDKRVGLCYDVGHANIKGKGGFGDTSRAETTDWNVWLEVMAPHLKHMHIHNNDGVRDYHWGLADNPNGTIDINALLKRAAELCAEDMTITAEVLAGEESFEWMKERGFL